jgi:hypothetical protein
VRNRASSPSLIAQLAISIVGATSSISGSASIRASLTPSVN